MIVHVLGPRNRQRIKELKSAGIIIINTTSSARSDWSSGLSPFFLGPVQLYGVEEAANVENAWQYSKVYKEHLDADGNPSYRYFQWARKGWKNKRARRYPMGKGAIPEYSWWDGKKLSYIEARKQIYVPLYMAAVVKSDAYSKLKELAATGEVGLWDFDGYDYLSMDKSLKEVLNDPERKMGHAFVLAMLLTLDKETIKEMLCFTE